MSSMTVIPLPTFDPTELLADLTLRRDRYCRDARLEEAVSVASSLVPILDPYAALGITGVRGEKGALVVSCAVEVDPEHARTAAGMLSALTGTPVLLERVLLFDEGSLGSISGNGAACRRVAEVGAVLRRPVSVPGFPAVTAPAVEFEAAHDALARHYLGVLSGNPFPTASYEQIKDTLASIVGCFSARPAEIRVNDVSGTAHIDIRENPFYLGTSEGQTLLSELAEVERRCTPLRIHVGLLLDDREVWRIASESFACDLPWEIRPEDLSTEKITIRVDPASALFSDSAGRAGWETALRSLTGRGVELAPAPVESNSACRAVRARDRFAPATLAERTNLRLEQRRCLPAFLRAEFSELPRSNTTVVSVPEGLPLQLVERCLTAQLPKFPYPVLIRTRVLTDDQRRTSSRDDLYEMLAFVDGLGSYSVRRDSAAFVLSYSSLVDERSAGLHDRLNELARGINRAFGVTVRIERQIRQPELERLVHGWMPSVLAVELDSVRRTVRIATGTFVAAERRAALQEELRSRFGLEVRYGYRDLSGPYPVARLRGFHDAKSRAEFLTDEEISQWEDRLSKRLPAGFIDPKVRYVQGRLVVSAKVPCALPEACMSAVRSLVASPLPALVQLEVHQNPAHCSMDQVRSYFDFVLPTGCFVKEASFQDKRWIVKVAATSAGERRLAKLLPQIPASFEIIIADRMEGAYGRTLDQLPRYMAREIVREATSAGVLSSVEGLGAALSRGKGAAVLEPEGERVRRLPVESAFAVDPGKVHRLGDAFAVRALSNGNTEINLYVVNPAYRAPFGSRAWDVARERGKGRQHLGFQAPMIPGLKDCLFEMSEARPGLALQYVFAPDGTMVHRGAKECRVRVDVRLSPATLGDQFENAGAYREPLILMERALRAFHDRGLRDGTCMEGFTRADILVKAAMRALREGVEGILQDQGVAIPSKKLYQSNGSERGMNSFKPYRDFAALVMAYQLTRVCRNMPPLPPSVVRAEEQEVLGCRTAHARAHSLVQRCGFLHTYNHSEFWGEVLRVKSNGTFIVDVGKGRCDPVSGCLAESPNGISQSVRVRERMKLRAVGLDVGRMAIIFDRRE